MNATTPDCTSPSLYTWQELVLNLGLSTPSSAPESNARGAPASYGRSSASIPDLMERQCRDGERTEHLLRLAGALFAKKFSLTDCTDLCLQWNARNHEPLDADKIERTCASLWQADQRNHPERHDVKVLDNSPPFFKLEDGRIDAYIAAPPQPRRWLIKDLVSLGKAGAVIAPGGSSKSQWLLQLAVGVATGIPVADHWEIGETGSALVFFAEDDQDEIHRRLHRIMQHLQRSNHSAELNGINERLYIFSTIGREMLLTRRSASGEVTTTERVSDIGDLAAQLPDLKLIVLDPASRFRGGEENSNEDATRFVEALETLAKQTQASVLIAHHTNKGSYSAESEPGQGASRGASALTDGLRWQMNLSPPRTEQLKAIGEPTSRGRNFVVATVTKTNYSAFPAPVMMERLEGGYLSVVSAQTAQKRAENAALAAVLYAIHQHGKPITARSLEETYAGVKKRLKMPKERMREIVKIALDRSLLVGGDRKALTITPLAHSTYGSFEAAGAPSSSSAGAAAADAPDTPEKASRKKS